MMAADPVSARISRLRSGDDPLVGAFLLPSIWRDWDRDTARRMLEELAGTGVTAICTEASEYRDDVIGWVHEAGLRFMAGIACFSDHENGNELLDLHPELWPILETGERRQALEWYVGLNPSVAWYREDRERLAVRIAREHDVDALFLDFVRWPLHWELELRPEARPPLRSSFDWHNIRTFAQWSGVDVPIDPIDSAGSAAWILKHAPDAWTDYRCWVISSFVANVASGVRSVRDDITLGAYVVPLVVEDLARAVGQRVSDLIDHLDLVAPMLYHTMVHQPVAWIGEILAEFDRAAPGRVLATLQVDSSEGAGFGADWGPPMPPSDWGAAAALALESTAVGLIGWTGTAMLQPARAAVLRTALAARVGPR
jgi:hypothetical protein